MGLCLQVRLVGCVVPIRGERKRREREKRPEDATRPRDTPTAERDPSSASAHPQAKASERAIVTAAEPPDRRPALLPRWI
jgi:hypothetical protein